MIAYMGGFRITDVAWSGSHAIRVTVETDYADRYLQLYAGRRLIGVSESAGELSVTGQLQPAHCPHALTVLIVEEEDRLTDFGQQLPPRPYNQVDLDWSAASFPDDAKWFEITASTAADGAVDPDNILARVEFIGDGDYSFLADPINAPGDWSYRITSRDDAMPLGNPCDTPAEDTIALLPYPPDVAMDDGIRLQAAVADGELTVSFAFDWDE